MSHKSTIIDQPADMLARVPYLTEYAGVWAMEPSAFNLLVQQAKSLDIGQHLAGPVAALQRGKGLDASAEMISKADNGVGVLHINGTLTKQASSLGMGTSTILARRALRSLVSDDSVKSIILRIDSPGGTVAGTKEFGDDVRAAARKKQVVTFAEDLAASAGYWVASQADQVFANAMAKVGSIGVFMSVSDFSKMAENEGVKVHVIKAGEYKGLGVQGAPVTDSQLAELQRIIDGTYEFFVQAVADGRKMTPDQVRELADGRVHLAADAQKLGLIDEISSFEELVARLGQSTTNRRRNMSDTTTQAAASVKEIKAACPGISSDLVLTYAEAGKTVEQCKDAYLQELATENAALQEQCTELKAKIEASEKEVEEKAKAAANDALGVDPIEHTPSSKATGGGSAHEQFREMVAEKVKGGMERMKASITVAKENPDLHAEMLAEAKAR